MGLPPPVKFYSPLKQEFLPGVITPMNERENLLGTATDVLAEQLLKQNVADDIAILATFHTLVVEPTLSIHLSSHPRAKEWNVSIPLTSRLVDSAILYPLLPLDSRRIPIEISQNGDVEVYVQTKRRAFKILSFIHNKVPESLPRILFTYGITQCHAEIAVLASHIPEFTDVITTNPQLAVYFAKHTHLGAPGSKNFEEIRNIVKKGPKCMIESLGLDPRPLTLKLLRRLCLKKLPLLLDLQNTLFNQSIGEAILNLRCSLSPSIFDWFRLHKIPLQPPILTAVNESRNFYFLLSTTFNHCRMFNLPIDFLSKIRSVKRLEKIQLELAQRAREEQDSLKHVPDNFQLPCPISHPNWLLPLNTVGVVRYWADKFANCARSYLDRVANREYYIFLAHDKAQPVMVGINLEESLPEVDQMETLGYDTVSDEFRKSIESWINRFKSL